MPTNTTATHVHVETASQDCDGRYDSTLIRAGDLTEGFHWFDLPVGDHTSLSLDCKDGLWVLEFSSPTDEGYTSSRLAECDGDCDFDERTQRDHTAEAAGY